MSVRGRVIRQALQVSSVGLNGVDVEVIVLFACEYYSTPVWRPLGKIVERSGKHPDLMRIHIDDAQAHLVLTPGAKDDFFAVGRKAWKARIRRARREIL